MIKGGILNKKRSEIKYLELNEIILWGFGVRQPLRARVVERQREFNRRLKLSPPDFLGAFCRRSGISERQGWALCHGAVVARAYGLPAVVGTLIGTKKIKTGQLIEGDGQSGVIRAYTEIISTGGQFEK